MSCILTLTKSSFVLPEVTADQAKIFFEGGAFYKGDTGKLIGSLSLEEMVGLAFAIPYSVYKINQKYTKKEIHLGRRKGMIRGINQTEPNEMAIYLLL